MRSADRMEPFLKEIKEIWEKHPDLRFGQLLSNFLAEAGDPFSWEEDVFIEKLKKHMEGTISCIVEPNMSKAEAWQRVIDINTNKTFHLPLQLIKGHLFVQLNETLWLIDTGAPTSFGKIQNLTFGSEHFVLDTSYHGFTSDTITKYVDIPCTGLIGVDILNCFDFIFDVPGGKLTVSKNELSCNGQNIHMDAVMGIPVVTAHIGGKDYPMIFDTGAQISYFQDNSLTGYPPSGNIADFHFTVGNYQVDTYNVSTSLGAAAFTLRCGKLPDPLGKTLTPVSVQGIVGNEILKNRIVGYFPRRSMMVL